jgi:triphosphatase
MIRLTDDQWERIRDHFPEEKIADGLAPVFTKNVRRRLKPIFETRVRRTVYPIQSGDSEIELTIDKGKVEAGRQSSPLCEVELELKRGESAELFKLARMLAEEVPVQLAVKSKAERGYALIVGEVPEAVKASPGREKATQFQGPAQHPIRAKRMCLRSSPKSEV